MILKRLALATVLAIAAPVVCQAVPTDFHVGDIVEVKTDPSPREKGKNHTNIVIMSEGYQGKVRATLTDGSTVEGYFDGHSDGEYKIKVGTRVDHLAESKVKSVQLIETASNQLPYDD